MEDAEEPAARHLHVLLPDPPVHARSVPRRALNLRLDELLITDPPERWAALRFRITPPRFCDVGPVRLRLGIDRADRTGIVGWYVYGRSAWDPPPREPAPPHPNGALGVDHVVMTTPDFERSLADLSAGGFELRRMRDAGENARQAFYVIGPALLELVGPRRAEGDGPARLWGVTFVVSDLDATAEMLGQLLGRPRDAVQPGRRIATVRREAGLATAVAFMTPRA